MLRGDSNAHPVADLDRVTCRRQGHTILEDISLRIPEGEHCALLGANGSGKTTLLKIITGYEWPSSGSVAVLGKRYGECAIQEVRKAIGWVSFALEGRMPGHMSGLDVVLTGLEAWLGVFRTFSRHEHLLAHEAMRRVGIEALAAQSFGVMSQGEKQRALIARALVAQPALLILDEPCAGLDPAAREHFLDGLGALATSAGAPTILLVTHHIEEIGPWVETAAVLKGGRMLAQGPVEQVLTSGTLQAAFDWPCHVEHRAGRYWLRPAERSESRASDLPAHHLRQRLSFPPHARNEG